MMMVIHPSVSCFLSSVGKACGKEGWALAPRGRGKPSGSGLAVGLQRGSRSLPTATGTAVLAPLGNAAAKVQPGGSPGWEGLGERQCSSCVGGKITLKRTNQVVETPLDATASPLCDCAPPHLLPQFPLPPCWHLGWRPEDIGTLDLGLRVADGWRGARQGEHVPRGRPAPS